MFSPDPLQALRQHLRIAELATRRELRAARHWVPGMLCPLDFRPTRHEIVLAVFADEAKWVSTLRPEQPASQSGNGSSRRPSRRRDPSRNRPPARKTFAGDPQLVSGRSDTAMSSQRKELVHAPASPPERFRIEASVSNVLTAIVTKDNDAAEVSGSIWLPIQELNSKMFFARS